MTRFRSIAAASIVALFALLSFAGSAHAQGVPWGCAGVTICNFTGCQMTLTMLTTPANFFTPITLAPGACVTLQTAGLISIDWVVSGGGFAYPVVPPPPGGFPAPLNSCPPGNWYVECMMFPAATCCADVCFDPVACTININPAACPPGCCRP